jgi:hypothetical protein
MAMTSAKLKDGLIALGLYSHEADAIEAWASAWNDYCAEAASNSLTMLPAALVPAKEAMMAAMVGLKVTGSASLQAGIIAWWGALPPAGTFTGATAITPPPTLSGIAAALSPVFLSNRGKSKADAVQAVADVLHTQNLGGQATFPPPVGPMPIL